MGDMIERTHYKLTVLSPLHIGTGQTLSAYDVAVIDEKLWRFDVDKVSARLVSDRRLLDRYIHEGAQALSDWPEEIRYACARYVLPWRGASPDSIREHIADPWGRLYVPGSSIKGAIRTAILWAYNYGISEEQKQRHRALIGQSTRKGKTRQAPKQWAGQALQKQVLGSSPNTDILRALQVGDSDPLPRTAIGVFPVRVAVRENNGRVTWFARPGVHRPRPDEVPLLWVEAIAPEVTTRVTISLDRFLLEDRTLVGFPHPASPSRHLMFNRKGRLLQNWAQRCNVRAWSLAREEYMWAKEYHFGAYESFYLQLLQKMKPHVTREPRVIYLPIGWGVGWRGKTVVEPLGDAAVSLVRQMYRLGKGPIFPKTRRVVFHQGRPVAPLGWICLERESSEGE